MTSYFVSPDIQGLSRKFPRIWILLAAPGGRKEGKSRMTWKAGEGGRWKGGRLGKVEGGRWEGGRWKVERWKAGEGGRLGKGEGGRWKALGRSQPIQ